MNASIEQRYEQHFQPHVERFVDNYRSFMMQASDDYIVHHKADNCDIVLFLFSGSSGIAATKKKVR